MNCLSNLKKIFDEDVSYGNLQAKIQELTDQLERVLLDKDKKKNYQPLFLELSARLRLHLANLEYNLAPAHKSELFENEDLDLADLAEMASLARMRNNYFSAKEIPFGAKAGNSAPSLCVEINLDFPDSEIEKEIKNILRVAREQPLRGHLDVFQRDSLGRLVPFPVDAAMKVLDDFEEFKIGRASTPTAAGKKMAASLKDAVNEDIYTRQMRKSINHRFFEYLHWHIDFKEEFSKESLSEEEKDLLSDGEKKILKIPSRQK